MVNPAKFGSLEELRQELIEIIETRLDESEIVPWAKVDQQFHFLRSQVVVLDTGKRVDSPAMLKEAVPELSRESIFYHFIDARRRTPGREDDFSAWLRGFGEEYAGLRKNLASIDPYFSTLNHLREILSHVFYEFFE